MSAIVAPIDAGSIEDLTALADGAYTAGADLVEVRLDRCARQGLMPEAALGAFAAMKLPVVATNRQRAEGGEWDGGEDDRLRWLLAADRAGAAYLDCELAAIQRLPARPQRARLVLSYHDFDGVGNELEAKVQAMYAAGADIAKIAIMPRDAADLDLLADLCARWGAHGEERLDDKGLIAIGMGEHGLPSRLLAGAWGSCWTFGHLGKASAPGQPTVSDLDQRYRVGDQGPDTRIFGVLGSPVGHSLSPVIHNSAFRADDLDAVYVPFLAEDALAFWRACCSWIDGLSITIPHKTALIGEMDECEELALRIGAINTIYRGEHGQPIGANTDAPAAVDCVEHVSGSVTGRRVLLLGAGGVSRAIAFAMHAAGARITIANRTPEKAAALAEEIGCEATSLEAAQDLEYDVLINGTSVGMESQESPWPVERHRHGSVVFDTVYTPLETRLLSESEHRGCIPVCGLSMLISQALGQYERWTGIQAPEPLMHRVALEALTTRWTTKLCRDQVSQALSDRGV